MYRFLRPLLFRLDPETAHRLTLRLLRFTGAVGPARRLATWLYRSPPQPVEAFGLKFRNPVGLAAGYDKDAEAWRGLATLGFGHLELGTVTSMPQPGNPAPRVFRLNKDEGLINRLGFPSAGAAVVVSRLRDRKPEDFVLGINIGKNKGTPLEIAAREYVILLRDFDRLADYLTVNVSSPNTIGLRRLQARDQLEKLLGALANARQRDPWVPILVKLSPDLDDAALDDAVGAVLDSGMDGIVATNTSVSRDGLRSQHAGEKGGLSGKPISRLSQDVLEKIVKRVDGRIPVVAAGGIMGPEGAQRRLDAGAALVQVYTGLVYRGPGIVKKILKNR